MSLKSVYLLAFFDFFNFALVLPVANPHVMALGGSFMLCGILQSAGAGVQLFASPIIGKWSDSYGRKIILLCTLSTSFIANAIAGINSLQSFFIGRILYGVAHHTEPLLKAVITDVYPDKQMQTKAFNNLFAVPGLAFIVAPVLGGLLHQYSGSFAAISMVLCTVDVLLIGTALMYIPDVKLKQKDRTQQKNDWKKFIDLLAIKFAVESAYNFFLVNSGLIFTAKYFLARTQIGFAISYISFTMMVAAILLPRINKQFYFNDTTGVKRILHSVILMSVTFTVLLFVNNAYLYLAVFIPASIAKFMLEMAWTEALTARTSESEKGFMLGVASSMLSAAGLVCPLISGLVGDYIGVNGLIVLPFVPSVLGLLLVCKTQKLHVH